jgi:hypothetical protein
MRMLHFRNSVRDAGIAREVDTLFSIDMPGFPHLQGVVSIGDGFFPAGSPGKRERTQSQTARRHHESPANMTQWRYC